jgi:hypothetical protein
MAVVNVLGPVRGPVIAACALFFLIGRARFIVNPNRSERRRQKFAVAAP